MITNHEIVDNGFLWVYHARSRENGNEEEDGHENAADNKLFAISDCAGHHLKFIVEYLSNGKSIGRWNTVSLEPKRQTTCFMEEGNKR